MGNWKAGEGGRPLQKPRLLIRAVSQIGQTEYEGTPWADLCLPFVVDVYANGDGPHIPIQSIAHPVGGWNGNTDPQDVWGKLQRRHDRNRDSAIWLTRLFRREARL